MKICAYCDHDNDKDKYIKMTREHVFPDFLHREQLKEGVYYSTSSRKYVKGALQVKDVCDTCNTKLLTKLDDYAKILYKDFFTRPVLDKIIFKYNYQTLMRWILKISYNADRAFEKDFTSLRPYRKYMIYGEPMPENILLFGTVMKISKINGKAIIPKDVRASVIKIPEETGGFIEIARAVTINSYMFIFLILKNNITEIDKDFVVNDLREKLGATIIDENKKEFVFDSNISSFDHISYKNQQRTIRPEIYQNDGVIDIDGKQFKLTNFT